MDIFFIKNFFLSSIISIVTVASLLINSKFLSLWSAKIGLFFGNKFNEIFFFYIYIAIIALLLNLLTLITFNVTPYYILIIINFFFSLIFLFLKYTKIILFLKKFLILPNIKINLFLIVLLLISLLPVTDPDSISVHLNFSRIFFENNKSLKDLYQNIELTTYFNTEIILMLSYMLKVSNLGSILNLVSLFFFLNLFIKKVKNSNFAILIFSSPLILYFCSSQKLQIFFGILYLLLFIKIFESINKQSIINKKKEIFGLCFLFFFYLSGKMSYVLIFFPLFIFFLIKNRNFFLHIVFFSIISFSLILLPIFLNKYFIWNNPFVPFFSTFFEQSYLYKIYSSMLTSSQGWLVNNKIDWMSIFSVVYPLQISNFTTFLGIAAILFILDYNFKDSKKLLVFFSFFLVIITGQILPRYYFELFLVMSYFYRKKINFFFSILLKLQFFVIFLFSFLFCLVSYKTLINNFNNNDYQKKFAFSYLDSIVINKFLNTDNILLLSYARDSIFFGKNIYHGKLLDIQNEKLFNNYIKKRNITKIISERNDLKISSFILTDQSFIFFLPLRNILRSGEKTKVYIYSKVLK